MPWLPISWSICVVDSFAVLPKEYPVLGIYGVAETGVDRNSGAWAKVPVWDGAPTSWRQFRREMKWWVSSLDLQSTKKYNLAARWLLRQSGIVRQCGEEYDPDDLAYKPEVVATDPETGQQIVVEAEDCLYGLNKLLTHCTRRHKRHDISGSKR